MLGSPGNSDSPSQIDTTDAPMAWDDPRSCAPNYELSRGPAQVATILLGHSPNPMQTLTQATPVPAAAPERRFGDRRQRPTPMLSRYSFVGGRRAGSRRREDDSSVFVDIYGGRLFTLALSIIGLNLLDAWFTLLFLAHGGREVNPFVQKVLDCGPFAFIIFKTFGIGICVAFLTITKNFRAARIGLITVFVGYTILLGWHLYLLANLDMAAF
jgi:hypothetical protein